MTGTVLSVKFGLALKTLVILTTLMFGLLTVSTNHIGSPGLAPCILAGRIVKWLTRSVLKKVGFAFRMVDWSNASISICKLLNDPLWANMLKLTTYASALYPNSGKSPHASVPPMFSSMLMRWVTQSVVKLLGEAVLEAAM